MIPLQYYSCAVMSTGAAKCWGQNAYGQVMLFDFVDHIVAHVCLLIFMSHDAMFCAARRQHNNTTIDAHRCLWIEQWGGFNRDGRGTFAVESLLRHMAKRGCA